MGKSPERDEARKFAAQNRKARFEYEILDRFEAGLALHGSEVKSLRAGKASLDEAYAAIDERDEVWLVGAHIDEYKQASYLGHEPRRQRKLLLHKSEILRIRQKLKEKGLTLVPLSIYFKDGRAKVEIALAKGRKHFDKREAIRRKEDRRQISRAVRRRI